MTDVGPARDDGRGEEPEEAFDSDLEDGDTVIARGWPRNRRNLAKHGFRPVWTAWDGYPGDEIPADIQEWLDENGERKTAQIIGPLRSLAWLAGLDELVEAIDHPAYIIQDDIEVVPLGTGLMWPLNRHMDEGTVPPRIWDKVSETQSSCTFLGSAAPLQHKPPAEVKETPAAHNLQDLYEASRIQPSGGTVKCIKVPFDKHLPRLETKIRRLIGRPLESKKLWFRGLGFEALESALAFFIPERNNRNSDNELGPGFHTADSLAYALEYVRGGGAIMVFRDPDLHSTRLWQPSLQDWNSWVARWLRLPLAIADQPIPSQYRTADFIKGAISADQADIGGRRLPTQSEGNQLVAVSYRGCQVLSESLDMIIFVERT